MISASMNTLPERHTEEDGRQSLSRLKVRHYVENNANGLPKLAYLSRCAEQRLEC
jgi:hypothetical protein